MSVLDECEAVLADLQLVAVAQPRVLHAFAVDIGAVQAALVDDVHTVVALLQDGVLARDGDVVQEDVALRRAPDARAAGPDRKLIARAPAAEPDHERRALDDGVHDLAVRPRLGRRREADRRLSLGQLDQARSAPRAEPRGLAVMVTALRAVHLARRSYDASSSRSGGGPLWARISVSRSMSTASVSSPPCRRLIRSTSSARRMSMRPCSRRRR